MRILRFAQNDKKGAQCFPLFTPSVRRAESSRPTHRRTTSLPCHSEAVRPKNPYSRPFSFLLRTKTGDADSSPSAQNDKEGTLRMTERGPQNNKEGGAENDGDPAWRWMPSVQLHATHA